MTRFIEVTDSRDNCNVYINVGLIMKVYALENGKASISFGYNTTVINTVETYKDVKRKIEQALNHM